MLITNKECIEVLVEACMHFNSNYVLNSRPITSLVSSVVYDVEGGDRKAVVVYRFQADFQRFV